MAEPNEQNGTPQPPEPASPQTGGMGDLYTDEGAVRENRQLLQRFPIRPEARPLIADAMLSIALGSDKPRNRIMASRVLAMFDKLNMEQEKRILGIPDTIVNVVQQVNLAGQEVAMMHASIPTPAQAALAAVGVKQNENGNGNGSNGNGNGPGNGRTS
jgi:hypothetical protein